MKENEETTYQNVWVVAKAVLRGKFVAMNTYVKKKKKGKISTQYPTFHLMKSEKEELTKSKARIRKEITKIREGINEKEKIENQWNQNLFFENVNKHLAKRAKMTKKKEVRLK